MKYKVISSFKGSLICKHFKRILKANSVVDIEDNLFWEKEVISLIRNGIFVPLEEYNYTAEPPIVHNEQTENESVKILEPVQSSSNQTDFNPVIWDFQKQGLESAQKIVPAPPPINTDSQNEIESTENIDFIEPQKIEETKDIEKKEKPPKKRNSKQNKDGLSPVGTIKPEPTLSDAAIELDSRGNPIRTTVDNLVEGRGFTSGEDIDFLGLGRE